MTDNQPLFIVFEGGEGSGKSTQVQRLSANLAQRGHTVFATHEPGATLVGKAIRSLLLETDEPITRRQRQPGLRSRRGLPGPSTARDPACRTYPVHQPEHRRNYRVVHPRSAGQDQLPG